MIYRVRQRVTAKYQYPKKIIQLRIQCYKSFHGRKKKREKKLTGIFQTSIGIPGGFLGAELLFLLVNWEIQLVDRYVSKPYFVLLKLVNVRFVPVFFKEFLNIKDGFVN